MRPCVLMSPSIGWMVNVPEGGAGSEEVGSGSGGPVAILMMCE